MHRNAQLLYLKEYVPSLFIFGVSIVTVLEVAYMVKYISTVFLFLFYSCYQPEEIEKYPHSLPVVRLRIDECYLWSPDSGLFVKGNNGISTSEFPFDANFNQKWEYPARFEYYENNQLILKENIGFRIKGRGSRKNPMKTVGLYWRGEYGKSTLEYPMFPESKNSTYKRLLLRSSGNDFGKTQLKDATVATIHKDYSHVDFQEYKPCVVYVNNDYWGIMNIREMITPRHFLYHYGVDHNEVDLLEGSDLNPVVDDGSADDFLADVINFIRHNDLSLNENYYELLNRIHIESFIDNIIINTYVANTDWPSRNTRWWRDKTSGNHNKWKWVVYDADYAFRQLNKDIVWIGDLYGDPYNIHLESGFFIFNHLIKNDEFVKRFLDRYLFFIDVVFEKERVASIVETNRLRIDEEYNSHRRKWNLMSRTRWMAEVDELVKVNNYRNNLMRELITALQQEREL